MLKSIAEPPIANKESQECLFRMLNDGVPVEFVVGFAVIDGCTQGYEIAWQSRIMHFEGHRALIERAAERAFSSDRCIGVVEPVRLLTEDFHAGPVISGPPSGRIRD